MFRDIGNLSPLGEVQGFEPCYLRELSKMIEMTEMLYVCAIQYSSHLPHVAIGCWRNDWCY